MILNLNNHSILGNRNIAICFLYGVLMKNPDFLLMHSMSLGTFLVFAIAVTVSCKKRKRFFTGQNLFFTVLTCLVIEATFFQLASWFIDRDFFVFSKADAMGYYLGALKMK